MRNTLFLVLLIVVSTISCAKLKLRKDDPTTTEEKKAFATEEVIAEFVMAKLKRFEILATESHKADLEAHIDGIKNGNADDFAEAVVAMFTEQLKKDQADIQKDQAYLDRANAGDWHAVVSDEVKEYHYKKDLANSIALRVGRNY